MGKIVLELQKNAIDPNIDTVTLLRQAYVIAKKLNLTEFEQWVTQELNGYELNAEIPDYRKLSGELKAFNPYRGWIPIIIDISKAQEILSNYRVKESISHLMSVLSAGKGVIVPFPVDVLIQMGFRVDPTISQYSLFLNEHSVESIVETVKNTLLDWSLMLEQNGILGEGLVFSEEEKSKLNNLV